jgi:hypothetical protein
MKSPGPDLNVIRLLQDATAPSPEVFQGQNEFLKSHHKTPLFRYALIAVRYIATGYGKRAHSKD